MTEEAQNQVRQIVAGAPLAGVAGMSGGDLKRRIESIISNRAVLKLNYARKAVLAVAAITAVVAPIAVSIVDAPFARAQSSTAQKRLAFDVASVKPAAVPSGVTLMEDG